MKKIKEDWYLIPVSCSWPLSRPPDLTGLTSHLDFNSRNKQPNHLTCQCPDDDIIIWSIRKSIKVRKTNPSLFTRCHWRLMVKYPPPRGVFEGLFAAFAAHCCAAWQVFCSLCISIVNIRALVTYQCAWIDVEGLIVIGRVVWVESVRSYVLQ